MGGPRCRPVTCTHYPSTRGPNTAQCGRTGRSCDNLRRASRAALGLVSNKLAGHVPGLRATMCIIQARHTNHHFRICMTQGRHHNRPCTAQDGCRRAEQAPEIERLAQSANSISLHRRTYRISFETLSRRTREHPKQAARLAVSAKESPVMVDNNDKSDVPRKRKSIFGGRRARSGDVPATPPDAAASPPVTPVQPDEKPSHPDAITPVAAEPHRRPRYGCLRRECDRAAAPFDVTSLSSPRPCGFRTAPGRPAPRPRRPARRVTHGASPGTPSIWGGGP